MTFLKDASGRLATAPGANRPRSGALDQVSGAELRGEGLLKAGVSVTVNINHNAPSDLAVEQVMGRIDSLTERDLPGHFIQ